MVFLWQNLIRGSMMSLDEARLHFDQSGVLLLNICIALNLHIQDFRSVFAKPICIFIFNKTD
jgi:hypothetical protein